MVRATTKEDLIISANRQFDKMWKLIETLSEEQQNATFAEEMAMVGKESHWSRDKNLRDVLVHLYEWHQLLINWINANCRGEHRAFLPAPYNWRTYPIMNVLFWKKHQDTLLAEAKEHLHVSHKEVINLIENFTCEELFTKGLFDWTGTSTLGAYCVSATTSHYNWAIKKIKKHIKNVSSTNDRCL